MIRALWTATASGGVACRPRAALALIASLCLAAAPVAGQAVTGGDFDICDYCGTLSGNTARLVGRAGAGGAAGTGTLRGAFILVNAASVEQDVDFDGFTAGVNFNRLYVADTTDFINVANPSLAILRTNLVVASFLNPLQNGFQNEVRFEVRIPAGTPAGIYRGRLEVQDSTLIPGLNPNGEPLRVDGFFIEIEVLADRALGLVEADTAAEADSLVLRGRAGQTVSGVIRVANLGNVDLSNVTMQATDLVSESGTGLRIRSERISVSPSPVTSIAIGDTARVVVTVRIPTGILAGRYTGDLIVQGAEVAQQRIPLTVIVTTPGEIVFENNPVRAPQDETAVIIFNADPGSTYRIAIFDMMALTAFRADGTVFAGTNGGGATFPGDQAVRFSWNLRNGRGEQVAGGMYYVIVDAQQDGQRRQLRSKLMVIR